MGIKINNIHDKFFKAIMSDKDFAVGFFKAILPEKMKAKLRFSEVDRLNTSYIDNYLEEIFSDIIFSVPFHSSDSKGMISLLVEHKSYDDKYLIVQLLRYLGNGYFAQIKDKIPTHLIVPVVLYHGKDSTNLKTFKELIGPIPKEFNRFLPNSDVVFVDLNKLSDETIQAFGNSFVTSVFLMQKYSNAPEILAKKISEIFNILDPDGKRNLIEPIIVYYIQITRLKRHRLFKIMENLKPAMKEKVMSTYDYAVQDGFEKGIEKGMKETQKQFVINGFRKGLSID